MNDADFHFLGVLAGHAVDQRLDRTLHIAFDDQVIVWTSPSPHRGEEIVGGGNTILRAQLLSAGQSRPLSAIERARSKSSMTNIESPAEGSKFNPLTITGMEGPAS